MDSLGARLARERDQRNITLHEISRTTKIQIRYLIAIEEGRFNQLPGGVITKGFLRAYVREIGLDEEEVIAEYLTIVRANQSEEVPKRVRSAPGEQNKEGMVAQIPGWAFAAATLILSFALVNLAHHRQESGDSNETTAASPPRQVDNPRADSVRGTHHAIAEDDANGKSTPLGRRPTEQPQSTNSVAGLTTVRNDKMAAGPGDNTETGPSTSGTFLVVIKARQDAWLSITADGKRIMYTTLAAPAETSVAARRQILIRAGDVGGLDFWFNGQHLPAQGDYDEAKTLNFDANGLESSTLRDSSLTATAPVPKPQ
jgi:cytoskeletal protein RodZ